MTGVQELPIPSPPPSPEVVVFGGGPGMSESILIALTIIAVLIGSIYILGPLVRAFARRIEGKGIAAGVQEELQRLRESAAEVDGLRDRIFEIEERLDFAERLLAHKPEAARLEPPRPGD